MDKPVLNAFGMFGMMNGRRVHVEGNWMYPLQLILDSSIRGPQTDIGALASKGKNNAGIMIWNYHDEDSEGEAETVQLTIKGLPARPITLTHYRIDNEHSNSYEVWKKMGSPQNPTPEQTKQLEAAGQLTQLGKTEKQKRCGTLLYTTRLPRQGVSFLSLSW